jgi:hypothetical protein
MPRRPSPALTDAELRIMRVLWERSEATVGEVVERLNSGNKPAYNTVLTMLKIRTGYVAHEGWPRVSICPRHRPIASPADGCLTSSRDSSTDRPQPWCSACLALIGER